MGDKNTHTKGSGCNCKECGQDLYAESNVLLEIKSAMDAHLDCTDTKMVGRPLFVIVIGDQGFELSYSPINNFDAKGNNEILISVLKDMLKDLKKSNKRIR
jgi:hypothetical protein